MSVCSDLKEVMTQRRSMNVEVNYGNNLLLFFEHQQAPFPFTPLPHNFIDPLEQHYTCML